MSPFAVMAFCHLEQPNSQIQPTIVMNAYLIPHFFERRPNLSFPTYKVFVCGWGGRGRRFCDALCFSYASCSLCALASQDDTPVDWLADGVRGGSEPIHSTSICSFVWRTPQDLQQAGGVFLLQ